MSRLAEIRQLAALGEELLATVTAEDPEELGTAFTAYDTAFEKVRAAAADGPYTPDEVVALTDVSTIHGKVEEAIQRRQAITNEMIGKLTEARQLKAYAPVQEVARAPRYLDASA